MKGLIMLALTLDGRNVNNWAACRAEQCGDAV